MTSGTITPGSSGGILDVTQGRRRQRSKVRCVVRHGRLDGARSDLWIRAVPRWQGEDRRCSLAVHTMSSIADGPDAGRGGALDHDRCCGHGRAERSVRTRRLLLLVGSTTGRTCRRASCLTARPTIRPAGTLSAMPRRLRYRRSTVPRSSVRDTSCRAMPNSQADGEPALGRYRPSPSSAHAKVSAVTSAPASTLPSAGLVATEWRGPMELSRSLCRRSHLAHVEARPGPTRTADSTRRSEPPRATVRAPAAFGIPGRPTRAIGHGDQAFANRFRAPVA